LVRFIKELNADVAILLEVPKSASFFSAEEDMRLSRVRCCAVEKAGLRSRIARMERLSLPTCLN